MIKRKCGNCYYCAIKTPNGKEFYPVCLANDLEEKVTLTRGHFCSMWKENNEKPKKNKTSFTKKDYEEALKIACELLNGATLYGVDKEKLFEVMMENEEFVSRNTWQKYILNNLDRFSDNSSDKERLEAIKRLGW